MLVMGGLLGAFGVGVDFLAHKAVLSSIDDDLKHRAQMFEHRPPWMDRGGDGPPSFADHSGDGPGDHGPGDHRLDDHGPGDHGPDGPQFSGDHDPGADRSSGPDFGPAGWIDDRSRGLTGAKAPSESLPKPALVTKSHAYSTAVGERGHLPQQPPNGAIQSTSSSDTSTPVPPPHIFWFDQKSNGQIPYNAEAFAEAKSKAHLVITTISINDHYYRVLTHPIIERGKVVGIGEALSPLEETFKTLDGVRRVLITMIIPAGVVLSGLASLYLMDRLTKPLRAINQNAESIGSHNAAERLPVVGQDEFASLATTLNGMLDRLEEGLRFEQSTNRKLEQTVLQQRRFTEDASHELKTPLAVIKANTGLMLHFGGNEEETRESVLSINGAADRMNHLVQDLLILARAEAGQLAPRFEHADLSQIARESIGHLSVSRERVALTVPSQPIPISASVDDLARVFVNLIDNALRHSETDCPVEVQVTRDQEFAIATVRDHGTGIAPEHLTRLFDRFYRVDRSRSSDTGGTGLGLAICKGIVEAHKGTIEVTSVEGQGTMFTLRIPLQ